MDKQYTSRDIQHFFEQFREMPECYELEKVHQLINNPSAMARWKGSTNFNLLKFIIMTTVLVTSFTCLFLWMIPEKHDANATSLAVSSVPKPMVKETTKPLTNQYALIVEKKGQEPAKMPESNLILPSEPATYHERPVITETEIKGDMNPGDPDCVWPKDSMVDKHKLFVYLTREEFKKLGVLMVGDSLYYRNNADDDKSGIQHSCNWRKSDWVTHYKFLFLYTSDTACTSQRWGDPFYNQIDTLIPIVNKDGLNWFTPHPSIFEQLPARYRYLKEVYENLKCMKKKSPGRQLVNYWDVKRNIVLDKINYIELTKDELTKLGFQFFKDSLSLSHPNYKMYFNLGGCLERSGTIGTTPYPPNPLPVLITDEKGLQQKYYGLDKQKGFNNSLFDMLVPVKVPLNEYVPCFNYYLIFWFYPTKEFINALPENIRPTLKSESESIINGQSMSNSSCTYFEVCKSTLQINDLKVYPNPVFSAATIEFKLPAEATGKISLVTISGNELKLLVSQTKFRQGYQTYNLDLSDVSSGIYLISIITDMGFKTQRIVVSK